MSWPTPELIQAAGVAVATVIAAVTTWQAREVAKLRTRVDVLEVALAAKDRKITLAFKLLRALLRHIGELEACLRHLGETPPVATYTIPDELAEEI
ncbi:hypothetical protein [Nocardia sp. NPDC059239]|uniref:hypothetical protein n=1 Tax=unclassified Nocardia TaxID=2637762 RepID=UPI00369505C8